jgi:hypothetical protein
VRGTRYQSRQTWVVFKNTRHQRLSLLRRERAHVDPLIHLLDTLHRAAVHACNQCFQRAPVTFFAASEFQQALARRGGVGVYSSCSFGSLTIAANSGWSCKTRAVNAARCALVSLRTSITVSPSSSASGRRSGLPSAFGAPSDLDEFSEVVQAAARAGSLRATRL